MLYKFGPLKKKIILTLLGGVTLGMAKSPSQYYRTLKAIRRDWEKINQHSFNRSLKRLSKEKLIEEIFLPNGSLKLILTEKGKIQAKKIGLMGSIAKFKKPKKWDKKWRVVLFDIPEKDRIFRDILRRHLKDLNFLKLQHSVFISPYSFEKTILELAKLYSAEKYIRVITALKIDNEKKLRKIFKIN